MLPCYSRAASVLVSEPTQHFGYVANSRSRFPILQSRNATSAWRALRRAASPLAASRHRLRSRRTYTWPREAAAPPLVKVRLPFGAEVQCTGSAIWRTAFLSILQWMCCGTLRPASLQMAGGSAMLMVPLSVHVFLHVVVRSSCSMRSCSARLWFGMSSRPLLGRTRGGPLAWSYAQCELPLAVHGSPAQVSSPGPRYSLRDVSASVPPGGCAAILDGVAAKAVHPSPCLFDGHMVRSTVCPSDSLAAIAATQVTGLSCGARYHGAPMRVRLHGYALWPFGYSVGLLLPSSHLPHHSVDSPALYYLFYPLPSPRTSGPVGRVQAQRSG